MKIAILTSGGVSRDGETAVIPCLLWLIERLVRSGDEVHVFSLYQEPEEGSWPLLGATIHCAGKKFGRLRMYRQVIAEHRKSPFSVLHAAWSLWASLIAVAVGKLLHIPSLLYFGSGELVNVCDLNYGTYASRKGRLLQRLAIAGADKIVVQSGPMLQNATKNKIAAQRIPLGVALDSWPVSPPRPRIPGSTAHLLHIGCVIPVKDHSMLLNTAAHLMASGTSFTLDLIGQDIHQDGQLERQINELGLSDRITFHGFLPHRLMRPFFERADLLLVTSRHEAGPLVVLEAAIAGLPAVGTDVGHLSEWSPDAAAVVPPRDHIAMTHAIRGLLSEEPRRLRIAARAQERAVAENADVTASQLREAYNQLANTYSDKRRDNSARRKLQGN